MKRLKVGLAIFCSTTAFGQSPDVAPFVELRPTWQVRSGRPDLFQWYDSFGRYSLVGARLIFENGLRGYVAQRFQRVSASGDPDTLDEYYIENRGHWRIGKQYLPFGRREILKSTVLGARLDTNLLLDQAPVTIAVCDGGSGRTRGVVGRFGESVGVSFALGNHFGIQPTDLVHFRFLEEAPGIERGYRLALGLDTQLSIGSSLVMAEWASLRRGETNLDKDQDLSDVRIRFKIPGTLYRSNLGWSRNWTSKRDYVMMEIEMKGDDHFSYMPFVRFQGLAFHDFGFSAVIKF